jgi:hypothetical protein
MDTERIEARVIRWFGSELRWYMSADWEWALLPLVMINVIIWGTGLRMSLNLW